MCVRFASGFRVDTSLFILFLPFFRGSFVLSATISAAFAQADNHTKSFDGKVGHWFGFERN